MRGFGALIGRKDLGRHALFYGGLIRCRFRIDIIPATIVGILDLLHAKGVGEHSEEPVGWDGVDGIICCRHSERTRRRS